MVEKDQTGELKRKKYFECDTLQNQPIMIAINRWIWGVPSWGSYDKKSLVKFEINQWNQILILYRIPYFLQPLWPKYLWHLQRHLYIKTQFREGARDVENTRWVHFWCRKVFERVQNHVLNLLRKRTFGAEKYFEYAPKARIRAI